MRLLSLLILSGLGAAAAAAHAQTPAPASRPATRQAAIRPAAAKSAASPRRRSDAPQASAGAPPGRARASGLADAAQDRKPAAKGQGFLALRTTDITGNKELPKVMVIVPWHAPADAGAVLKPADSLMSEVLGPVDRGVFQRRIRYYGQLNGDGAPPPPAGASGAPANRGRTR